MRDFNHTVGVLVKAFFDGTLVHTNCHACAAGNLIAEAKGYKFIPCKDEPYRRVAWDAYNGEYYSPADAWYEVCVYNSPDKTGFDQIHSTGYSVDEIRRIEHAFEFATYGDSDLDWIFNGLMAVVDVLADIHNIDLKQKEEAKALFIKH